MKVLAYSRVGLAQDQGTPLRFRHLVQSLARLEGVNLQLVSRENSSAAARVLPDVTHFPAILGAEHEALLAQVKAFKPDVVYGLTDKAAYDMSALKRMTAQTKLVVDLHSYLPTERLEEGGRSFMGKWIAAVRAWVNQKRHFPQMDGFTSVGQVLADKMAYLGKPIEVLWGGVNTEVFRVIKPAPSSDVQVAYAGNYRPYQGVTTLIEAASLLVSRKEPFHFTLVGDIDKFPAVKALAQSGLGQQVTLTGRVPYENVPEILGNADVLVVPRSPSGAAQYNYPSKLSEYLSLRKAVVVHGVGEVIYVIKNGENGLIVPPESPKALAEALLMLKDAALRDKLGGQARKFVEQELSWEHIGKKLHDFLQRLLVT